MDLNTVEVLGLWNQPHIGGENLYLSYPPGSARKGGLMNTISGDPGVIMHTLLSFLPTSTLRQRVPPISYDFHWLLPKGIQDKVGKPRFGLSQLSQAGRFFFLTQIGSYQESRSLQLVTIGGLILQQQKWLVNLWFDRLVISESDSVLDDGMILFSVQYLTR